MATSPEAEAEELAHAFERVVLAPLNSTLRPVLSIDRFRMVTSEATRWCEIVLTPAAGAVKSIDAIHALAQEASRIGRSTPPPWWAATTVIKHVDMPSSGGLIERTVVVSIHPERPAFHPDTRQLFIRFGQGLALVALLFFLVLWIQPTT